jgi:hypothetical protein
MFHGWWVPPRFKGGVRGGMGRLQLAEHWSHRLASAISGDFVSRRKSAVTTGRRRNGARYGRA